MFARLQQDAGCRRLKKVKAVDLTLTAGHFHNSDRTPAVILDQIGPGASGVMLVDADAAIPLIQTLTDVQADELSLLIIGSQCPCQSVLVGGCIHHLGGQHILAAFRANADVTLPDFTFVLFEAFRDEIESQAWQQIAAAPVRTVMELFAEAGVAKPFPHHGGADSSMAAGHVCQNMQRKCPSPPVSSIQGWRLSSRSVATTTYMQR